MKKKVVQPETKVENPHGHRKLVALFLLIVSIMVSIIISVKKVPEPEPKKIKYRLEGFTRTFEKRNQECDSFKVIGNTAIIYNEGDSTLYVNYPIRFYFDEE